MPRNPFSKFDSDENITPPDGGALQHGHDSPINENPSSKRSMFDVSPRKLTEKTLEFVRKHKILLGTLGAMWAAFHFVDDSTKHKLGSLNNTDPDATEKSIKSDSDTNGNNSTKQPDTTYTIDPFPKTYN